MGHATQGFRVKDSHTHPPMRTWRTCAHADASVAPAGRASSAARQCMLCTNDCIETPPHPPPPTALSLPNTLLPRRTRKQGTERHLLCIEDPFETSHDLGRTVGRDGCTLLRREFERAARVCATSGDVVAELFEAVDLPEGAAGAGAVRPAVLLGRPVRGRGRGAERGRGGGGRGGGRGEGDALVGSLEEDAGSWLASLMDKAMAAKDG